MKTGKDKRIPVAISNFHVKHTCIVSKLGNGESNVRGFESVFLLLQGWTPRKGAQIETQQLGTTSFPWCLLILLSLHHECADVAYDN